MSSDQTDGRETVELVRRTLGSLLGPGDLGALMARAGVGKTACLTHIALEHLLADQAVLHVCIGGPAEKIKIWYQELIKNLHRSLPRDDCAARQRHIESRRFILAYLHSTFNPGKLELSLKNLEEQTDFHPSLIVLDGLDFERDPRATTEELQGFARAHAVSMWMSIRTHRHIDVVNQHGIPYPCHETDDLFKAILLLEHRSKAIDVRVLKRGESYRPEQADVFLNPQTFLLG